MIIDSHTHIFPEEVREHRDSFCDQDEGFGSLYRDPGARLAGAEDLIVSMDESGVDASVVCGFPWKAPGLCGLHNEYLLEAASRYPHRLVVFLSLPFSDPERSLEALEHGLRKGARGVGELAFYGPEMTSHDLERMGPVLGVMEERGVPLLLHANETIGHAYPGKGKTPLDRFFELAVSFRKLRMILAHWGGGLLFYELMPEVARALGHVYYDTAASPFLYSRKIYRLGCEIVGAERILFGSDFPLLSSKRYFREVSESGVSEEDRKKIFGGNMAKLLGLDQQR